MVNLALTVLLAVTSAAAADIKRDEVVLFYPTYAYATEDDKTWTLLIHGSIFQPEQDSVKRTLLIAAMRRTLGVQPHSPEAAILDQRLRPFLVDHKKGREIDIQIGSTVARLGKSTSDGHIATQILLPADKVPPAAGAQDAAERWLSFETVMPQGDQRRFFGRVLLVGRSGLSVISDIDDTIKISQVRDRKALLANTFLREFQAVPDMAELYRQLAAAGAVFHYVSGSPWQLYEPLAQFCRSERFPPGVFHLKDFRLSDPSALLKLTAQEDYKLAAIAPILAAFPGRRFVLVGDSGEQDPEIYGKLAGKYGRQIAAILIRNVTDEKPDGARFRKAFAGFDRWRLFRQPDELRPLVTELLRTK